MEEYSMNNEDIKVLIQVLEKIQSNKWNDRHKVVLTTIALDTLNNLATVSPEIALSIYKAQARVKRAS